MTQDDGVTQDDEGRLRIDKDSSFDTSTSSFRRCFNTESNVLSRVVIEILNQVQDDGVTQDDRDSSFDTSTSSFRRCFNTESNVLGSVVIEILNQVEDYGGYSGRLRWTTLKWRGLFL